MTEHQTESTLIHFFRSAVLLAALIVVPAMAVCWNMIPKDFFEHGEYERTSLLPIDSAAVTLDSKELNDEESVETSTVPLPSVPQTEISTETVSTVNTSSQPNQPIRTMSGSDVFSTEQPIPNSFTANSSIVQAAKFAAEPASPAPKFSNEYSVESSAPQQSAQKGFPILESQLKLLGAKYYRLEKWGSRGELFRFSCYVAPSGPYQYQKYFQAIDSDELRVMENVIEDIKRWKKSE